jgi:indolepyruvate ferredoxin oxidoreductase
MTLHDVSLADRFDLKKDTVLLGGIQALVRVLLMQKARDEAAGLTTAGYATGYRGSPLGGVDQSMWKAREELQAADVNFEPGLNEDLAATALWGSQQVNLHGEGRVQGVFGLWYGKGPGVDRCGDVFRHANMAGTAEFGGVVACLGVLPNRDSATVIHNYELAGVDVLLAVL